MGTSRQCCICRLRWSMYVASRLSMRVHVDLGRSMSFTSVHVGPCRSMSVHVVLMCVHVGLCLSTSCPCGRSCQIPRQGPCRSLSVLFFFVRDQNGTSQKRWVGFWECITSRRCSSSAKVQHDITWPNNGELRWYRIPLVCSVQEETK